MKRINETARIELLKCKKCRFNYVNSKDEIARHAKHHDQVVNGLHWPKLSGEKVVNHKNDSRIIRIDPSSPLRQHRRVIELGRLANLETRYGWGLYSLESRYLPTHPNIFIRIKDKRAIGLLIVSQLKVAFRYNWKTNKPVPIKQPTTSWTVNHLWVLQKYRDIFVAENLFWNMMGSLDIFLPKELAWDHPLTPTEEFIARKFYRGMALMACS